MQYSLSELTVYLMLYSFLGWAVEVCCFAVTNRRFINRGFLNLPFALPYGITAVILIQALPTLEFHYILQYLMAGVVFWMVWKLTDQFVKSVSRGHGMDGCAESVPFGMRLLVCMLIAAAFLLLYLIVHPLVFGLVELLPKWLVRGIAVVFTLLTAVDFGSVCYTLRTSVPVKRAEERKAGTRRLEERMTGAIWDRLRKAYPGIRIGAKEPVFAKGICFDKLVWVFLISSFLGALIEMVYCRIVGGTWMNRSSVLYGAFSFVWGFGAVVLTVVLQRLAGKEDRKVLLAGFVVGGAYEYLCSVFTELVFGTVFWDYSDMPLNIGGRTNVMFCIFWGLLSVVWVKILYPPMEKGIEQIPPLTGKIITWAIVILMVCNGLLTSAAMIRYTGRQMQPQPQNVIEQFLDERYDDAWMENRWPNMKIT